GARGSRVSASCCYSSPSWVLVPLDGGCGVSPPRVTLGYPAGALPPSRKVVHVTGLIAALVSAMVYGVGLTVEQRALHRSEPIGIRRPLHLARVLFGNPQWLAGCVLAALGSVGLIVSLGLAPVSVVQPTFAGGISLTLLLLSLAQQQRISRGELAALGIMPVALLLLALSLGPRDAAAVTVPHLPLLVTVSGVTLAVCAAGVALVGGGRASAALMGGAAGLAQGVAGLHGKGIGGLLADHGLFAALVPVLLSPF